MNNNETTVETTTSSLPIGNTVLGEGWNLCSEVLPDKKPNWEHTEQCLVWYSSVEGGRTAGYGVAYYHYSPPFRDKGQWIDFAHYGQQPIVWQHIQPPSFA